MPSFFIFQPSPRIPPQLPEGAIELAAPRNLSAPTAGALKDQILGTLGPSLAGLMASVVMLRFSRFQVGGSTQSGMMSMGIAAGIFALGYPIINLIYRHNSNLRKYREEHTLRNAQYRTRVQEIVAQLESYADTQRNARLLSDPDLAGCQARLERVDSRLWERTPIDPDFLCLRVGLGDEPLCVELKVPNIDPRLAAECRDDSIALLEQASKQVEQYRRVSRTPVRLPLPLAGCSAIVGPVREELVRALNALVLQLASHHSPAETRIVGFYSNHEEADWLRWLPHTWNEDRSLRYLAADPTSVIELGNWLAKEFVARGGKVGLPRFVVLVYEARLLEGHEVWPRLLSSGPACGIYPIVLGYSADDLPRETRAMLTIGKTTSELLVLQEKGPFRSTVIVDQLAGDRAEAFSRQMAPFRLGEGQNREVPMQASLLDTMAVRDLDDLHLAERWRASQPGSSLAVPIGLTYARKVLTLDLLEVGPHGLVAGMPRSGKTEFLVTYLVSMAAYFHPHEVAFICVDYKGGEIFRHLYQIPHLIATLTNLESDESAGYMTRRCLLGLQEELRRRQRLFQSVSNEEQKVKTIAEYQALARRGRVKEPLPRILIVCDEYRELMTRDPAFVEGLVSVAVVGASLGLHLILATQNPEGIVTSQIEATVGFRFCFRLDQEFARPFIGGAEPGQIPVALKGRGFYRVGGRAQLEEFQAAYSGSHVASRADASEFPPIAEVALSGKRELLQTEKLPQLGRPQVETLSAIIAESARDEGCERLPGPWLPPMETLIFLPQVREAQGWDGSRWECHEAWLNPSVGQIDDPARQAQPPCRIDFSQDGNLGVYGKPGSGLTSFLRTLVVSLAHDHSPAEVHFYLTDFGGGVLGGLKNLPHVGDVVLPEDGDKLSRLFRFLLGLLQRRKIQFSRAGCTTLESYREATGEVLPAIFLLIDNYAGMASDFPECEEHLVRYAQEGRGAGLYLVFTANSPSLVKYKLSVNIGNAVCLQLTDPHDQVTVVGRSEGFQALKSPGRGFIKASPPLEIQTAMPIPGNNQTERTQNLILLMDRMNLVWKGGRPAPIPMLPDIVPLESLFKPEELEWDLSYSPMVTSVPVGLTALDVVPFHLDLAEGPQFVVTGGYGSGKTTFLRTWLLSLAGHVPPQKLRIVLVDFAHGPLRSLESLPHVSHLVSDDMKLGDVLSELQEEQTQWRNWKTAQEQSRNGSHAPSPTQWLIVIDEVESFIQQAGILNKGRLQELLKKNRTGGLYLVSAGNTGDFSSNSFDPLVKTLLAAKSGVLLGTKEDQGVFGALRLAMDTNSPRPGDGYFVRRGQMEARFRGATPDRGVFSLFDWIEQITWKTATEVSG